jgi:plasmid maintenance system antidote protein VapI
MQARKRFEAEIKKVGGPEQAALSLGVSRTMVDFLVAGDRSPGLELALKIEALYGIPPKEWVPAIEVATVKRIA